METIINEYELTFILRPDLGEDVNNRIIEKLTGVIDRFEGQLFINDPWGMRKLAYPIKKHNSGYYVYFNYAGPAELPAELERLIRLDDNIIRFLTVRLEENIDVEEAQQGAAARHKQWTDRRNAQDDRSSRN